MGVFSYSIGCFDAFTLTLPQDVAFEYREAAHDIEKHLGERVNSVAIRAITGLTWMELMGRNNSNSRNIFRESFCV